MPRNIITIDAKNKMLGRLASEVAVLLQGKNSATYLPNKIIENKVKVINISKIKFSGKKMENKVYKRHTGYLGGLKVKKLSDVFEKDPKELFVKTVRGMLPKNKLLKERLKYLIIEE